MFFIYLFLQYDTTRPIAPQPTEDRIYASNNHGHVVYLNSKEQDNLYYLGFGAFILFGIGALTGYHASHPKRLGEINSKVLAFVYSLFTIAGWSAAGRGLRQEAKSIAESVGGILTGTDTIGLRSDNLVDNCRTELEKQVCLNALNISGDVSGNKIHLYMVRKELRNSFAPHFYGKLQARPSGTIVRGRFTLARFVMAFLGVWFGGIGVVTIIISPSAIKTLVTAGSLVPSPFLGAFSPPLLFVFCLLILHWGYRLGRNDKAHIPEFLQPTLNARQESYL